MAKLEPEDSFFIKKNDGTVIISTVDHIKKRIMVDLKNHVNIEIDIIVSTNGDEFDELNDGPILKIKDFRDVFSDEKILTFIKEKIEEDKNKEVVKTKEEIEQEEQNKLIERLLSLNKNK